jgi:16S rRNA (guanine966-N2)-methyltransferase
MRMRVIAGEFGGRQFDAPKGHRTHPMSEKARGGLFGALGDIEDLTILDAFAGSGALSFEALSRGAKHVTAIDVDMNAHKTIQANAKTLGLGPDRIKIIRANCSGWSDNNPDAEFDLVFAAPPYDDLQLTAVSKMIPHTKDGGIFILDWPGKTELPQLDGLKLLDNKNYGDAQLAFYRKTG